MELMVLVSGETRNCYNLGSSSQNSIICNANYANSYIAKCYYLTGTANKVVIWGTAMDDLSGEMTKEKMQSEDFLELLNICDDEQYQNMWEKDINNINDGYPILKWQNNG